MGVSFLMCASADRNPALVRIRPVEPGFGMDVWLLTHPDLRQNARVRAFMDHMAEALSSQRDLYAGDIATA
jgi:DNA-binding transcriptional LysR family regulator